MTKSRRGDELSFTQQVAGVRLPLLVVLACLARGGESSGQTVVPVHMEPRHRLVLDRFPIRVLDVLIMPGDTTLFHRHDSPILYVRIQTPQTNSQTLGQPWRSGPRRAASERPGMGDVTVNVRYAQQPLSHRVSNIDTTIFHLIAVANYSAGDAGAGAQAMAPPAGSVEVDNTHYRTSRILLAPGQSTEWLRYQNAVVGVQSSHGRAEVQFRDGKVQALTAAGDWFFSEELGEYRLSNSGDADVEIVVVEVRQTSKRPPA